MITSSLPESDRATTALIALDWGTSSLRAYRYGKQGQVLEQRAQPWGIMQLPAATEARPEGSNDEAGANLAGFRRALQAICGDWLQAAADVALLAAGMVGSKQGWAEAPYLETPLTLASLSHSLTLVDTGLGRPLHIVPGVLQRTALPNVMRGEETQVAGILDQLQASDMLIGLPGSHSKWVHVQQQRISHFETFMTGEMFAALCHHTILGRTMQTDGDMDDAAFLRGIEVAQSAYGRAGLLSNIFSARTLGLTGALSPRGQHDYLSGLLIGHEVAALQALQPHALAQRIALTGTAALCQRYRQALMLAGARQVEIVPAATAHGLWQLARQAGLVAEPLSMKEAAC